MQKQAGDFKPYRVFDNVDPQYFGVTYRNLVWPTSLTASQIQQVQQQSTAAPTTFVVGGTVPSSPSGQLEAISTTGAQLRLTYDSTDYATLTVNSAGVLTIATFGSAPGLIIGSFTTGSVVFAASTGALSQDNANLFYDNTNKRLGLGTSSPTGVLECRSTSQAQLRLAYDATHYYSFTVGTGSNNILTMAPNGVGVYVFNNIGETIWCATPGSMTEGLNLVEVYTSSSYAGANFHIVSPIGTLINSSTLRWSLRLDGTVTADNLFLTQRHNTGSGLSSTYTVMEWNFSNCDTLIGFNLGVFTKIPRRHLDVLTGDGNPQARLTYTDNSVYTDLLTDSSGNFAITPTGTLITLGNGQDIKWGKALVSLGGGAAPTLGTIGGSGPTTAAQNSWLQIKDSTGATCWTPVWK